MTDMNAPQDDPFAMAVFAASCAAQVLRQAASAAAPTHNVLPELVQCLLEPGRPGTEETLALALGRPETRGLAEELIARLCVTEFPALAAASSGVIEQREQGRFRLRLAPSLDPAGPVYLLIEQLDSDADRPGLLIGVSVDGAPAAIAPLPEGNVFPLQILFEANAPIPRLFRDPDSRFFLT